MFLWPQIQWCFFIYLYVSCSLTILKLHILRNALWQCGFLCLHRLMLDANPFTPPGSVTHQEVNLT